MTKRVLHVEVKGIIWKFKLFSTKHYTQLHGTDSKGVCMCDDLEVHFSKDDFTLNVVRHELYHVYYHSCLVSSAQLKKDDPEEIGAGIWEFHLPEANQKAEFIFRSFNESNQSGI